MMKAYPEYKNSGIEWLDQIPKDWLRLPLKYLTNSFVKDGPHETPVFLDEGVPFLSVDGIQKNKLIFEGCRHISVEDDILYSKKCKPKKGDVLLGKAASVGKVAYVDTDKDFNVWSPLAVINPKSEVDGKYIFYSLQSKFLQSLCEIKSNSNTQSNLGMKDIDNLIFCLPSTNERNSIVSFLDFETSKVDRLIEEKENFINLLQEKRQALISHVVTKGLNPNVPMKDSGVEWIGEIPEHWNVCKAKHIADITRGAILRPVDEPAYFEENGEWAYLNISDATKCGKYLYNSKLKLSELGSTKSARVAPDNVILTASATIGKVFINKIKVCVHDGFIPFKNVKVEKDYLYHFLSNPLLYVALGKSNTQKNIYLDEVKNMMFTVPSREEQLEIVKYIESKLKLYDEITLETKRSLELLKEHRTALISAAVTGKIDVREEA